MRLAVRTKIFLGYSTDHSYHLKWEAGLLLAALSGASHWMTVGNFQSQELKQEETYIRLRLGRDYSGRCPSKMSLAALGSTTRRGPLFRAHNW
jgi:hypothetical protein